MCDADKSRMLTELSQPELEARLEDWGWTYISPRAREDRAGAAGGAGRPPAPGLYREPRIRSIPPGWSIDQSKAR